MAVYSRVQFLPGYPHIHNINGVEMIIVETMILPHVTILGLYRLPRIPMQQLCVALAQTLSLVTSQFTVFIGYFNVNWLDKASRKQLYNFLLFIRNTGN